MLLNILKKGLEEHKGICVEELPNVLWANRTSVRTPTGETPFALVYGIEAVILAEVGLPTYWIQHFNLNYNNKGLKENLDLLEERQEEATNRMASNKRKVE